MLTVTPRVTAVASSHPTGVLWSAWCTCVGMTPSPRSSYPCPGFGSRPFLPARLVTGLGGKVGDGLSQALFPGDLWRPAEQFACEGGIGLAPTGVVHGPVDEGDR